MLIKLAALLGLEGVDEKAIEAAVFALQSRIDRSKIGQIDGALDVRKRLASIVGLPASAAESHILEAVQALLAADGGRFRAVVGRARRERKVSGSMWGTFARMAARSPSDASTWLDRAPALAVAELVTACSNSLSDTEQAACKALGMTEEAFARGRPVAQSHGLSDTEQAACKALGMTEEEFARGRPVAPQSHGLSSTELAACKALGMTEEAFASGRAVAPQSHGLSGTERAACKALGMSEDAFSQGRSNK